MHVFVLYTWTQGSFVIVLLFMKKLSIIISIFQPEKAVAYEDLPNVDKYALYQLSTVVDGTTESFDNFQFYRFFQVRAFTTLSAES